MSRRNYSKVSQQDKFDPTFEGASPERTESGHGKPYSIAGVELPVRGADTKMQTGAGIIISQAESQTILFLAFNFKMIQCNVNKNNC